MVKRLFDITCSFIGLVFLSWIFLIIALLVAVDSSGGVLYRQVRVGLMGKDFYLLKFRTMHSKAEKKGLLTVGAKDPRVTRVGYFLRKYKLDELPQLINVLIGEMSLVGPRPEVRKYVDLYDDNQRKILHVRPGITDYASLEYFDENERLGRSSDPEKTYVEEIMPEKLRLNEKYIKDHGLLVDIRIIVRTILRILR